MASAATRIFAAQIAIALLARPRRACACPRSSAASARARSRLRSSVPSGQSLRGYAQRSNTSGKIIDICLPSIHFPPPCTVAKRRILEMGAAPSWAREGCSLFFKISVIIALLSVALLGPAAAERSKAKIIGPLVASGNPNYFKDASGEVLILTGSHTWNTLQDWGTHGSPQTLDFDAFVSFLIAHGHNFTLLWAMELPRVCGLPSTAHLAPDLTVSPHPWQRTGPGTATDGGLKFDLTKFDQSISIACATRTEALRNAGIYVGVYLFTGEFLNAFRCSSDGYPFSGANNVNGVDDGYGGGAQGIGAITMNAPTLSPRFRTLMWRRRSTH